MCFQIQVSNISQIEEKTTGQDRKQFPWVVFAQPEESSHALPKQQIAGCQAGLSLDWMLFP